MRLPQCHTALSSQTLQLLQLLSKGKNPGEGWLRCRPSDSGHEVFMGRGKGWGEYENKRTWPLSSGDFPMKLGLL